MPNAAKKLFSDENRKYEKPLLFAACLFFLILYVSLCFNNNIWTDEGFTIELIQGNLKEIILGTAADVHPPLYYIILKPFTVVFGSSLLVMKLVSILPMILTMALGGACIYRRFGFGSGILFILFLGSIPCTMEYAVQVRMYSWAVFFVTMMSLTALELVCEKSYLCGVVLGLLGAACAYTHYFAFVAALWIYGYLFLFTIIKKRSLFKYWLLACLVSLLVFAPWYRFMRIQVSGVSKNYWIEPITAKTWGEFMPFLFGMDIPKADIIWGILLVSALIVLIVRLLGQGSKKSENTVSKEEPAAFAEGPDTTAVVSGTEPDTETMADSIFPLLCFVTVVSVLITGVVISNLLRPIFIIRYLLPCMGLTAAFLSISFGRIKEKSLLAALCFFCIAATSVDMGVSIYREYTWTKTDATEAFLSANVGENDIIAYNYEGYKFVYDYYWSDDEKILWMDVDLNNCPYENIWLLDTIFMPWPTDEYLAGFGWVREYCGNYGIEHNDFKIWRLHRQ